MYCCRLRGLLYCVPAPLFIRRTLRQRPAAPLAGGIALFLRLAVSPACIYTHTSREIPRKFDKSQQESGMSVIQVVAGAKIGVTIIY